MSWVVVGVFLIASENFAQNSSVIELFFSTNETFYGVPTPIQELKIGNCIGCSYDIDSIAMYPRINKSFAEWENPFWPPGFSVMSIDLTGRPRTPKSGMYHDYRGYNPTQKDTFYIEIKHDDETDTSSLTIIWPPTSELALRCDSMFLINLKDPHDPDDDIKTNMFEIESLFVPHYTVLDPTPQMKYMIYKYGVRLIDTLKGNPTAVRDEYKDVPKEFELYSNYPNPFNPTTTISFDLPFTSIVTLKIYDVLGQETQKLLGNELMYKGEHEIEFSATDRNASGVYFYRIVAEQTGNAGVGKTFTQVRKMVLLR